MFLPNIEQFKKKFTDTLYGKFAMK